MQPTVCDLVTGTSVVWGKNSSAASLPVCPEGQDLAGPALSWPGPHPVARQLPRYSRAPGSPWAASSRAWEPRSQTHGPRGCRQVLFPCRGACGPVRTPRPGGRACLLSDTRPVLVPRELDSRRVSTGQRRKEARVELPRKEGSHWEEDGEDEGEGGWGCSTGDGTLGPPPSGGLTAGDTLWRLAAKRSRNGSQHQAPPAARGALWLGWGVQAPPQLPSIWNESEPPATPLALCFVLNERYVLPPLACHSVCSA